MSPTSPGNHFIIVSYDIVDNRKRNRVFQYMKNYGAPVQKSVFECRLPLTKLGEMKEGLRRLIDLEEDSIRIYRICESCLQKTTIIGIGIVTEPLGPSIVT